jgi:predicted TIM-barrel fold metal-dependent hydrolase
MKEIKIIDCHAHVFPDSIAEKAVKNLENYYKMPWSGNGTVGQLKESIKNSNIFRVIVFSTATKPSQVRSINSYIAGLCDDRIIGFGTIHPEYRDYKGEIGRIMSLGLLGIKLHPDFQGFAIDDKRMLPIYSEIEGKMPVLIHMGDENSDNSSPQRLSRVIEMFPGLVVIASHLGGYMRWDEAEKYLIGKKIYLDTSSTLCKLSPQRAGELILAHGTEKVLFGTDYPARLHAQELESFMKISLSNEDRAKILSENAMKLFNINNTSN